MNEYGRMLPKEVGALLGVSRRRIDQFIASGALHTERDDRNVRTFDRLEVEALVRKRMHRRNAKRGGGLQLSGEIVGMVFRHFERPNCTLAEVVLETKLPPDIVRYLYAEWSTPLGQPSPPMRAPRLGSRKTPASPEELETFVHKLMGGAG